jgi:site-specific recombinase XerD
LSEKIGFAVCPYSIRHTFATQSIINGVDVVTIAALMGHKDLEMLNRIYQHVQKNKPYLKEALRKAIEMPKPIPVSAAASA